MRVIAATNRDLREFVREGRFREDLYYRLSVFELYIPPLRERGSDIELLVNHFLDHFKRQHGRARLALSPDARDKLLGYSWPGNVRQLRNVIDSAVVMCEGLVDPARRSGPARCRHRRPARIAADRLLGTQTDPGSPQAHRRQRARSGQAARVSAARRSIARSKSTILSVRVRM